jgi:hypothetical protein
LDRHKAGLSEHHLIRELQTTESFADWTSDDPALALFQKHFAVMHCLYHLRPNYAEQGRELAISPLNIRLFSTGQVEVSGRQLTESVGGIREFYLDWTNFTSATPETVSDLLRSFWQRYSTLDKVTEALQVLELDGCADWIQVQAQYRRLVVEHHPDKGGDRARFTRVRQAYEVLKKSFKG